MSNLTLDRAGFSKSVYQIETTDRVLGGPGAVANVQAQTLGNDAYYMFLRGLGDYSSTETYITGDRVIGDDGNTYRSIADANLGNTPSSSPLKWERWGFSASDVSPRVTASCNGSYSRLFIQNDATTPNSKVTIRADELVLKDSNGLAIVVSALNLTLNMASSGSLGLDTGTEANSTWYAIWGISNGTTASAIFSASFTAPTLPIGYTFKALLGAVRNDSSGNFVLFYQVNNYVGTIQQTALTNGQTATPNVYQSLSLAAMVPPTALCVSGICGSSAGGAGTAYLSIAGNSVGIGKVAYNAGSFGITGTTGFGTNTPYKVVMMTPQTIWWTQEATGFSTSRIDVTGWYY